MRSRHALAALLLAAALAAPAAAATPPSPGIRSFAELQTPLPFPYDEHAHADADVARARARARTSHKLLLIDLGGNWCPDCRILAGTMDLPNMRRFFDSRYEVVTVDVGRFDTNLQVPARYGFTERLKGVPTLLVVDPATDKVINRNDVFALSSAGSMSPQALADWLAKWVK